MARPPKRPRIASVEHWQAGRDSDPGFVTALARGLEILRAFRPDDELLGNGELAERTGIPRSTVSRLTQTLTALGYMRYLPRFEKYQLGAGILALGYRHLAASGLRAAARPHMQALANAADCAIAMGTPDRLSMIYTEVCHGAGPMILRLGVGSRIPIALTSMGRAYLSVLPERERQIVLGRIRDSDPDGWDDTKRTLDDAMQHYRAHGFCMSLGAWHHGISSAGVAVAMDGGAQILAFNCGGASQRLTQSTIERRFGPALVDMAEHIRRDLFTAAPTADPVNALHSTVGV
ncbi:Transcriptional regulator [alpha proteobacterium BAL199]|jgi:DNA-binding IclR family transcriptional regulator|nr:Transcriptional regulator [alpha proteobacterium BAL199]